MRMVDKYFQAYGIETVGEVVDMTDARLLHVPGVGPKTVTLIRRGIARFLTARGVDGAADAY